MKRYLVESIREDLQEKMLFLGGVAFARALCGIQQWRYYIQDLPV
jgi:hypothetical protein